MMCVQFTIYCILLFLGWLLLYLYRYYRLYMYRYCISYIYYTLQLVGAKQGNTNRFVGFCSIPFISYRYLMTSDVIMDTVPTTDTKSSQHNRQHQPNNIYTRIYLLYIHLSIQGVCTRIEIIQPIKWSKYYVRIVVCFGVFQILVRFYTIRPTKRVHIECTDFLWCMCVWLCASPPSNLLPT